MNLQPKNTAIHWATKVKPIDSFTHLRGEIDSVMKSAFLQQNQGSYLYPLFLFLLFFRCHQQDLQQHEITSETKLDKKDGVNIFHDNIFKTFSAYIRENASPWKEPSSLPYHIRYPASIQFYPLTWAQPFGNSALQYAR